MRQRVKTSRPGGDLPLPVVRALRKLGQDIRDARRRRRIPVAVAAERASISKTTWLKVEKGDPGVLAGTYAKALFVLGLVEKIAQLADPANDSVGLRLEEEQLPRRIRHKKGNPSGGLWRFHLCRSRRRATLRRAFVGARARRKRALRSSTIPHGCKIPSVFLWSLLFSLAPAHSTRRTTFRCSVPSAIQRRIVGDER
jgi:hypothetical protein